MGQGMGMYRKIVESMCQVEISLGLARPCAAWGGAGLVLPPRDPCGGKFRGQVSRTMLPKLPHSRKQASS